MERLTDNPNPIPLGLVVKKGWNSRSAVSAPKPGPVSHTVTSAVSGSGELVRTVNFRDLLAVSFIASIALRSR